MADLLRAHRGRRVVVHVGNTAIAGTLQHVDNHEMALAGAELLGEAGSGEITRTPVDGEQVIRRDAAPWVQVLP